MCGVAVSLVSFQRTATNLLTSEVIQGMADLCFSWALNFNLFWGKSTAFSDRISPMVVESLTIASIYLSSVNLCHASYTNQEFHLPWGNYCHCLKMHKYHVNTVFSKSKYKYHIFHVRNNGKSLVQNWSSYILHRLWHLSCGKIAFRQLRFMILPVIQCFSSTMAAIISCDVFICSSFGLILSSLQISH